MFIRIEGIGIETFAGTVPFAHFEYFQSKDIELEDYNEFLQDFDGESTLDIPEEHNFVLEVGSSLIDIDNLWGMQGAILSANNTLIVESGNEDEWQCDCSLATLQSHGIKILAVSDATKIMNEQLSSSTAIVESTQIIVGTVFADEEVGSDTDFDPKQLEIHYHDSGLGMIIKTIKYADQELHNTGIDVEVESSSYDWVVK